jgi:DNA-binding NarL/FixJ family response regulator
VARGLTDAQVAEMLVISPRTVNAHLRSIYSKLNISSRSAATYFALEHHLISNFRLLPLSALAKSLAPR